MEARNITIVSTQNQNKYVVNTDATTLRELKVALNQAGINYADMTFYEGLSHTELLTDDAVLPHDVPYRGVTTNELVFMLTTPNKKIRSGVTAFETRQALYDAIEERGLKDACIHVYGKNFTQCKNSELMALIENSEESCTCEEEDSLEKAFRLLVSILYNYDVIDSEDVDDINEALGDVDENPSRYSQSEIDKMFDFLN